MDTVTSRDGTPIAYWQSGSGPPLLLCHGATSDHTTTWRFVLPALEQNHTVLAMDRRGRGGSGDTLPYDLQREAEDVAAVVDSVGEPVDVFGHSYGGLCALEGSLLTRNMRRLILYESVPLRGTGMYDPAIIERLEALAQAGATERLVLTMFRDLLETPPEEIEVVRAQRDAWETRVRNAPTMPRELRGEQAYTFRPERFQNMLVPTVLLVGEDSPQREHENAQGVAAGLPDARVVLLPGQQHAAVYVAPDLVVHEVERFLSAFEGG